MILIDLIIFSGLIHDLSMHSVYAVYERNSPILTELSPTIVDSDFPIVRKKIRMV